MGGINRSASSTERAQASVANGDRRHLIRAGETLSQLAALYNLTLEELLEANKQIRNPDRIFAGQTLNIPAPRAARRNGANRSTPTSYTVKPGDTMWDIAAQRGIDLERLIEANAQLRNPRLIYPGQRLRLPARPSAREEGQNEVRQPARTRPNETPRPERTETRTQAPRTDETPRTDNARTQPVDGNGFAPVNLDTFLRGGSSSEAAIIVGTSEGNRTPSGGFRGSYRGHTDPGNEVHNIGSFSYQGGRARTPEEADRIWQQELRRVTPRYVEAARRAGLDPNNSLLASSYYDLYTQSPRSAGRFLNQLSRLSREGVTPQNIIEARMRSYIDPATGRLSASGFDNDPVKLRADQTRRTNELVRALTARGYRRQTTNPQPERTNPVQSPTANRYEPAPSLKDVRAGRAVLRRGQQGEAVSHIQRLLGIEADGKFGTQTERAVEAFQREHGLRPPAGSEGRIGQTTLATLERNAARVEGQRPDARTERAGLPNTEGMTTAQKYDLYAGYIQRHGSASARQDLAAGRRVILGLRVPTSTRANNGLGAYDDRFVVLWTDRNGTRHVSEFRGNTEPAAYYEDTPANRRAGHNVTTINAGGDSRGDLGRIPEGSYTFRKEFRSGFGRSQDAAGRNILRPTRDIIAERDTNHDGNIDGRDPVTNRANLNSGRTMYFHRGGRGNFTGSAGCQTLKQADFDAFWQSLGGQEEFKYVLVDVGRG
ncbi:MAG TPA: LysM peptidoglycan-binding domain-containing protein [Pyrinomonadaceae bacterium]|jgi:spore coat assembly protein SafA